MRDGRFRACPSTANCVSSQAPASDEEHHVAPLRFSDTFEQAKTRLLAVLADMGLEVITDKERYIHAEDTSLIFRFVDDLELYFPEDESIVHVRSASRMGSSDLGVNRGRVDDLREGFER